MNACATRLGIPIPDQLPDEDLIDKGIRGVDPKQVYRRPAVSAYTALSEGKPFEVAKSIGELRLMQLIGGDLQLTKRQTSNTNLQVMSGDGIQYYRRTLTGDENCALCVIASTQRYRIQRRLMPIHPGCDCGQEPLPKNQAWEQVIDPDTLEAAHDAVENAGFTADRSGRAPDYRKLIVTSNHGEYGPVMSLADYQETKKD